MRHARIFVVVLVLIVSTQIFAATTVVPSKAKAWNPEYIILMLESLYQEHHEVQLHLDDLQTKKASPLTDSIIVRIDIEESSALCNSIVYLYNKVAIRDKKITGESGFPESLDPFLCTR